MRVRACKEGECDEGTLIHYDCVSSWASFCLVREVYCALFFVMTRLHRLFLYYETCAHSFMCYYSWIIIVEWFVCPVQDG